MLRTVQVFIKIFLPYSIYVTRAFCPHPQGDTKSYLALFHLCSYKRCFCDTSHIRDTTMSTLCNRFDISFYHCFSCTNDWVRPAFVSQVEIVFLRFHYKCLLLCRHGYFCLTPRKPVWLLALTVVDAKGYFVSFFFLNSILYCNILGWAYYALICTANAAAVNSMITSTTVVEVMTQDAMIGSLGRTRWRHEVLDWPSF